MIAVISHDAGGAEVLSSHVRRLGLDCCYVLDGPAKKVFARKLGVVEISSLHEAVAQAESILCGTSWQSSLEFDAIRMARSMGKHTIAFLDHWANYRERFTRGGETCLPDEIWVGDSAAESIARKIFPSTRIRVVENPYFQDIRSELAALPRHRPRVSRGISVLYVCEPTRDHARLQFGDERHWGYVEEDALRYFLSNIASLNGPIGQIRIRPHPAEPVGKYDWVHQEFNLPIETAGQKTLTEEISESDVVAGCQSMAMVVGLLAGKRVISCIPPGGKPCALPQPEIERLSDLLSAAQKEKIL